MQVQRSSLSNIGRLAEHSGLGVHNFRDDDPVRASAAAAHEPEPHAGQDGPLSVSTRIEYSALQRGQSRTVFGLVTVKAEAAAAAAAAQERRAMDLVCVLDVSGSMAGQKIEELKKAVRYVISNEVGPQDRLSIVSFNSVASRCLHLAAMGPAGKDEATAQTLRLTAGGGTSIAAGLHMGLEVMEQRRQRNKVSAILLLTDGQDSSAYSALPGLLNRARTLGCAVYAFGFGADHDSTMLRQIAEQAQTPYTFIESEDTVREAFAGVVGGLSSIVAQSVELQITCNVGLAQVHTPFEVRRQAAAAAAAAAAVNTFESVTVVIPDVFAGERRDVLLELLVPGDLQGNDAGQAVLLTASVRYQDLTRGDVAVRSAPVALEVSCLDEQPEMEPDTEVSDQRDRVEVARVLEEAAASSDLGNFQAAQQLLQQQQEKICKRESPVSAALQEELRDAANRMQNQMQWAQVGRAEVQDAMQMHKMQRCTNSAPSRSANVSKSSKMMYLSATQCESIEKSKAF